jgi:hypothetical protein
MPAMSVIEDGMQISCVDDARATPLPAQSIVAGHTCHRADGY